MSNEKVNPIELAKSGDCKAIDFLMNRQLNPQGITARSASHNGCLRVILESETVPSQEKLIPFIDRGIRGLKTNIFSDLEICGKARDSHEVAWKQRISLESKKTQQLPSQSKENSKGIANNIRKDYDFPIELKGTNGTLVIEDNKIRIIRHGGLLGTHKKGSRDISYSEILSYQYAPPKGFTSEGFFYFQLADDVPEITRKDSLLNENSVQFANLNELQDKILPKINEVLSQKIVTAQPEGDFFLGDNGSLTLKDSFLSINRSSRKVLGDTSAVGNKNIPYGSITAVQLHKSEKTFLGYTKGFLQLTIQGGRETQGGIASAMSDENTITFETEEKNIEFAKAKRMIEQKIQQFHSPSSPSDNSSSLDVLEKLASLKEKGIITEEEFQAKKKQILGL